MGRKINHLIVAFLLLQFLSATGTAGIARIHQRLQDSVSTSGKDTVWVEINPKTGSFKDERVTDYVTVGIDPFYHKYITDTSQYIISLSFDAYDASNSFVSSTSHTFTVTHDLFGKTSMRDKDLFKFNGAYRYKVTFVSATKNGSSITRLPDYIYIDADIEVERYYYFASYSSSTFTVTSNELNIDCDSLSTPDELEISWNACFASAAVCPESYDLEWTFVNDYTSTSGSYKSASLLDYDFGGNSTRISTTDNKYRVSLVYEHGYIIYRVRGIGRDTANVNIPIVGAWSLAESGTVSSASSSRYHVTQSHEGNKNWQYNASFAEEGKKKEVVSYFDGSLRNRQSVTKMNSSNNAIVGETIYDHQGRPAINVLPVPVDFPTCDSSSQPAIRFYPNFNQDDSTFAYTRNDFDLDSTGYSCISPTGPMGTSSGASHYYSPSNPDKTDQQAFVPDANKYPFTQVEYTPDNTGRIRTQGGVGPVFQLNSGHATQYFYGQPTQIELDRMFGSEVGDALHYKKNIVIDANGQASMTYLDMEGRTIATSLAGEIDTNRLSPLSSYSASVNLTADLFNKNSRGVSGLNKINSEGNAVVFSTQLLVSNNGYHDFSYNVIVDTLADSCLRENVCFSCIYDLEMHVYNGCGEDKLAQYRGDTLKKTIGHFSIDTLNNLVFTTVCSDSNRVNELDTFNLFLEAGNYTISKTLRVNKNALDYYVAQYLDSTNNSCYRTRNSFVAEEMGNVDTSGCHVTCASCLAKLGDRDAFVADGKGSYMEYDALADACQAPCKALSECYIHYLQMVSDVSLGGQYGQYQDNSGNMNPTPYALSVYNTQNYLPKNLLVGPYGSAIPSGTGNWRHPQVRLNNVDYTHYVDENGHISMISIALVSPGVYSPLVVSTSTTVVKYDSLTNTYYTYPENLADFDDFARNWKAAWAKSLVKYHPEYCYYETCSGFGEKASGDYTTSDDFDIILRSTTTFGSAASIGLTNIANFTNVNDSLPYDPFLLRYSTYGTRLSNLLSTYSPQPLSGYTLNMQQMAAYATRCGMQYGNHDTTGCIDFGSAAPDSIKDLEWNTFKGMYLSAKQLLQQEYMTGIVKSGSCPGYNGCFNVTFNGHGSYELYGEYGDIFQPCGSATFFLYTNKIPRFGDAATFMPTTINQIAYESYLVTGQCPVTTDLQNLLNQVAINGKLKIASNDSLKDYNRFTPRLYQALGGSNNHYSEFTWNSITSGDTITSSFKDSAGATVCSLVIDLSTSGIGTFSNYKVIGFSGLSDTTYTPHHAHSFRAYMALHDTVADTIVYKKVLGYTSCFDLTGCKFDQTCMPNDFAIDLQNLMSVLANNHKIATSHVYLTDTLYRPYITFPIKNELGTTTSDSLVWNYNNFGKRFELYDSLNPSLKIIIHLGDTASIDFDDTLVFANIYAFKNINSLYENNFSIQIIDSLKSNDVTLKGFVQKKSGSTVLSGISMGSCGYPTSFNCEGAQYKLQNDLQQLVHDALVSMPSSHDVDLTKLPGFTYLLKSMFPLNLDSTSSVLFTDASDTTNYRSHLVFTIKSTIDSTYTDSCYFVLRADTVHGFDSIVNFTGLRGYGELDANGSYHKFFGLAKYSVGAGAPATDTIFGESCMPILNCCACGSNDTIASTTSYVPSDTCLTSYGNFKSAIKVIDSSFYARIFSLHFDTLILSYYDITTFGYCNCLDSYANYLNTYSDTINPPVTILNYTACPNSNYNSSTDTTCEKNFTDYEVYVSLYNSFVKGLTSPGIPIKKYTAFSFNSSGLCDCAAAYESYLASFIDHTVPISQLDTSLLDIAAFCQNRFQPPCKTYVTADSATFPTGFPASPPPDSSCGQYAISIAAINGENKYNQYRDSLTTGFVTKYLNHCLGAFEKFTDDYSDKEYHFTLYYYDQAGNLIRTIPPEGVQLVNVTGPPDSAFTIPLNAADSISYDRTYNKHLFTTDHALPTTYLYNSLNQLVKQSMPDHDPVDLWEYTLPNGLNSSLKITGVQFINENQGYLTGYITLADTIKPGITKRGYIYSTINGGKSWLPMSDVVASDLNKLQMVTARTGYAIGKDGILLKTIDAGYNWDIVPTFSRYTNAWGSAPEWKDLYFKDSIRGIVTGTNGKSLLIDLSQSVASHRIKTVSLDAGATDILTGVTYDGSYAYASATSSDGYGYIYQSTVDPFSTDSLRWSKVNTGVTANDLLDAQFLSGDTTKGFMSGVSGTLLRSVDAGSHWISVATGIDKSIQSVFFRNDSVGLALIDSVAGKQKLYKTFTGGRSWVQMDSSGKYYKDFAAYKSSTTSTADKLFAVGDNGKIVRIVANTYNSPSTVYVGKAPFFGLGTVNSPTNKTRFNAVAVATYTASSISKPKVIIGAANGKVYFASNADSTFLRWDSLNIGVPIKKVALALNGSGNDMQAVAIDTNGVLYGINISTSDTSMITFGGTTPKFIDVSYNNSIGAFYAFDNVNHKVQKLTFGGGAHPHIAATYVNTNSSITNAHAIAFMGKSLFVAGDSGDVFKDSTLIAGSPVWISMSSSLKLLPLNDIQTDHGGTPKLYAVGNNGTLLQKASGTWNKKATGTSRNLNSIKFYSTGLGMIAANGAAMYAVNVSGTTVGLNKVNTGTTNTADLNDVICIPNKLTVAIGNNGLLYLINDITATQPLTASPYVLNTHSFTGLSLSPAGTLYAVGDGNSIYQIGTNSLMRVSSIFSQEIFKAHFASVTNGYLVGENGFIRHTSDGQTWQMVLPDLSPATLDTATNVLTYATDKALIIGKDAYLAKIAGTNTPVQISTGALSGTPDLNDIAIGKNTDDTAFVVGNSKTAFKINTNTFALSAYTIPSLPLPSSYDLKALHVFLDNSFMAVGSKGAVLFHNKGNNNWYRHAPPNPPSSSDSTLYTFNDVFFHDDRNGYVVGNKGVALRWSGTTNLQRINANTMAATANFIAKPTVDILGATDSTKFDISCIAFSGRYYGFMGGAYPDSINQAKYARCLHDETQMFSTTFWYDALGRMVLSQNSKQYAKSPRAYSYTTYDALGRITEVGEKPENTTSAQTRFANIFGQVISGVNYGIINNDSLQSWLAAGSRKEVTHTFYDTVAVDSIPLAQENLRKRVSAVTYEDNDDGDPETYNHATFYSYDIHGNVKSLLQDNTSLAVLKQQYKKVDYDYDLISGKVNNVYYEKDSLDAFTHHYEYDADNRITEVFTSSYPAARWTGNQCDPLWDRDAKYIYYAHGPLARVELGEHHVQGMDYAYTLQGWIKAVNSEGLQPAYDMGRDGLHDTSYNANVLFAKDAFGYSLTYYSQDYSAIGWTSDSTKRFLASQHYAPGDPSDLIHYRHDLFNGNIGTMVTSVTNPGDRTAMGLASSYKYDQLNRIVEANSFDELLSFNNIWNNENWYYSWESFANNNRFKYDANGNILEQVRKDEVGRTFDSLLYRYKNDSRGRLAQNRLYHVNDTITASMMNDDIDDEGVFDPTVTTINTVNNYSYDKIGNLVRDSAEGIATIDWTVYGKMKSVTHRTGYYKLNGTDTVRPPDLVFNYDAAGNRVSKIVKPRSRTGVLGDTAFMSTYYVRDAQGNILSTYTLHDSTQISALYFKQTEKHIYGSSRLGMERTEKQLIGATFSTDTTNHYLGNKQYELSNHLGNVVTTVSDKKIPKDTMEVITVYSSPDAARASIDSLGGLKIYPQAPWGYSGMNFVFPTITGQNYKIDFYLNLANTDPDSVMGHWPAVLYPDNTFNDLNHTGHYSLTWNATDTITAIKACYLNSTDGLHYFMFDSLKITKVSSAVDTFVTYNADIKSVTDYYAFGAPIQGRTWSASSSVYGMNGQEKDDEIAGTGNIMTAEHWEYDSRIGRRWNLDPVDQKSVSNYATFKDNPILYSDPNGASATDKKLFDRETGKQVGYQKDANGTEFVTEEYGHFKDGGFISEMTITPDQRKAYDDIAERTRISRLPSPAQKAIYAFADQAPKVIFGTAAVVLAAPVAVEVGLFSATGSLATSVAGGSADFLAQMTFNGGNIKKVNWTNVAASAIFKNPLTSAAIGSVAEGSIDKGFNNSLLFGNKTLKTATIETTFGTLGNIVGGKGGTIGGELFDMGGRGAGKIFGETFGNYQGQFLGNSLTKASGQ